MHRYFTYILTFLAISAAGALLPAQVKAANGAHIYETHCALCHQSGAAGVKGQFPRLAGRLEGFADSETGRRFLAEVVLFGMMGKIEVDGATITGVMPGFPMLSDKDLAAVLSFIIKMDGAKRRNARQLITPADIERVRATAPLSPMQVHKRRQEIFSSGSKPLENPPNG